MYVRMEKEPVGEFCQVYYITYNSHTIQKDLLSFKEFKKYEHPDVNCNYEHPRGGICLLIKKDKLEYVKCVE